LTVIEPNNISLTSLTNRPNLVCNPNNGGAGTTTQFFNTGCFQRLTLPPMQVRLETKAATL